MTTPEFLQSLADRAEKKVGGMGAVAGTKKHDYAKRLGDRAQRMLGDKGLKFEVRYLENKEWIRGMPLKGSTRLDVFDTINRKVYDYKFVKNPGNGLRKAQVDKIKAHGPEDIKEIIEINPLKKVKE